MSRVFQVKPKPHQTYKRHRPHTRNGCDSDNPVAHRQPLLQWSQGTVGGIHAPLRLRLQEGMLQS